MKKIKVLLINDHVLLNGGGDVVLHSEKQYLESCGYEVYLYGWGAEPSEEGNIIVCKESLSPKSRYYNKFICAQEKRKHFKDTLKRIAPDIIHIHLVSKYPLAIYPELKGYKVIQTLHGPNLFCATSWGCIKCSSEPCPMGIGYKCYRNRCVPFSSMLLYSTLDKRLKNYLNNYITYWHCPSRNIYKTAFNLGFQKLVYIPLGIDKKFSEDKQYKNCTEEKNILFVGAISEVKGITYLYDAFKLVKEDIPEAKLLIAGGGPYLDELKKRVALDKMGDGVEVMGKVPHDEIDNVYKRATVFAMPSIWQEQFGLVGPEALAMGIPVVGSSIGGIPEWLHHNEWGFLVTPRDTKTLAQRLIQLLNNPELSYNMGQRGRQFVINEYPYWEYVRRLELLIQAFYNGEDFRNNY